DRPVAVNVCLLHALRPQIGHPLLRPVHQILDQPELDRVSRARLGAGRLQTVAQPIVAERALVGLVVTDARPAVAQVKGDDAEGASRHAVATAVADILLHDHGVELGADDRPGRAGLHAPGVDAVLADVAHHQPVGLERAHRRGAPPLAVADALDEGDMPPGRATEVARVVVAVASEPELVHRQLVPLLAGDLAGLAADAQRRVGQEAHRPWPGAGRTRPARLVADYLGAHPRPSSSVLRVSRPLRRLQVNAFASWIREFGSSTSALRSFAMPPVAMPL